MIENRLNHVVNIPGITPEAQIGDFGGAARNGELISQAVNWLDNLRKQLDAGGFPRGDYWGQVGRWLPDKSFLSFKPNSSDPNSSDHGGVLTLMDPYKGTEVQIVIPADQALKPNPSVVVEVFREGVQEKTEEIPNARIEMRNGTLYVNERPWSDYSGDQSPESWIKELGTTKLADLSLLPKSIDGKLLEWDKTDGAASVWFRQVGPDGTHIRQVGPDGKPRLSQWSLGGEVRLDKNGTLVVVNHPDKSIVKLETAVRRLMKWPP